MKKVIKASDDTQFTNKDLVAMLNAAGIDTTLSKYELYAEGYERYGGGSRYKKKFTCPGDWLAFLSMLIHEQPNAKAIEEEIGVEDLEYYIEEYPTVKDIGEHASVNWWGDGDDYIYYLKNLSTGSILYSGGEEDEDEYEEEWED